MGKMQFTMVSFCHISDFCIYHVAHKTFLEFSKLSLINVQDLHRTQSNEPWDHSSSQDGLQ